MNLNQHWNNEATGVGKNQDIIEVNGGASLLAGGSGSMKRVRGASWNFEPDSMTHATIILDTKR